MKAGLLLASEGFVVRQFDKGEDFVLPYGKTRWVITRGRCLWDEHGSVLEIICVTIDLSAQKQCDLQLQVQR